MRSMNHPILGYPKLGGESIELIYPVCPKS